MSNNFCSGFTEVPALHYTPSIKDIFVGYEAEFNWATYGAFVNVNNDDDLTVSFVPTKLWEPIVCGYNEHMLDSKRTPEEFHVILKMGNLRTPYLTHEQIDKEGWEFVHQGAMDTFQQFEKKDQNVWMYFYNQQKTITIIKGNSYPIYSGSCPSINELRTIMKLLNIK
jgi:hypothetical protein